MILIINGPNLNLVGRREPEIYGDVSFEEYIPELRTLFPGKEIEYFQSNCEGAIIDKFHEAGFGASCEGIVINPGAYAHYSYAIADAIASIPVPVVEVHISNIMAREEHRRKSVTAESCKAMICGMGLKGYEMAIRFLLE